MDKQVTEKMLAGCLLGTAIGDALGLPFEGLSRGRIEKIKPDLTRYHLIFHKGMVSDDTEHACMVAQALTRSQGDPSLFSRSLAGRLRIWFLGLPAGIGMATGRAIIKLLLGFSPNKSGVWSAGNGPAMRSPIIGVAYGDDHSKLRTLVHSSTIMTHSDPKAEYGALAVALAAHMQSQDAAEPGTYETTLRTLLEDDQANELLSLVSSVTESVTQNTSTTEFAASLGLEKGISGYIYHSVPVALHAWLSHPNDINKALESIILCGGDTDTVAAIAGGIIGAKGTHALPAQLLKDLIDWPLNKAWIETLSTSLHKSIQLNQSRKPPGLFFPLVLIRNFLFLLIVLLHGFRRLLPPY